MTLQVLLVVLLHLVVREEARVELGLDVLPVELDSDEDDLLLAVTVPA